MHFQTDTASFDIGFDCSGDLPPDKFDVLQDFEYHQSCSGTAAEFYSRSIPMDLCLGQGHSVYSF